MSKVKFTSISGFDGFEGMLNMELLWTNANPTSNFAAQMVNLDLSKYENILIVFQTDKTSAVYIDEVLKVGGGTAVIGNMYNSAKYVYRRATPLLSGVDFYAGVSIQYPAMSANTNDNTVMIPYIIYGIN